MTMKLYIIILVFVSLMTVACGKKDRIYENFCKRFYENANRAQEEIDSEILYPPHKSPPSYEQYQRDRQAMLNGQKKINIRNIGQTQPAAIDETHLVMHPIQSPEIDESLIE